MLNYQGNGGDNGISYQNDVTITFNTPVVGQFTTTIEPGSDKGIYIEKVKSNAIINNSLSAGNQTVSSLSNYVSVSQVNETAVGDYYRSNAFFNIAPGYNQNKVTIRFKYDNMSTSVNLADAMYSDPYSFPVQIPFYPAPVTKYLNETELVESNNPNIALTALNITFGCTDYREAIIKLCQWIETNIKAVSGNPSNKSSVVYSSKSGDCDGMAHLLAAFCRSLKIPARIVGGYIIEHGVSYPINKAGTSSLTLGSGAGTTLVGHAACEIYIPYMNDWVRCDPAQRTTLFGPQQFIKTTMGTDSKDQLQYGAYFTFNSSQPRPITAVTSVTSSRSVSISSHTAEYEFVSSETFPGTASTSNNFGLLCASGEQYAVGIYDNIIIIDPEPERVIYPALDNGLPPNTYIMHPCSTANFHVMFTTGSTPRTYPTAFDWKIVLYRADGTEYVYAQQNGMMANTMHPIYYFTDEGCFWQFNTGSLPAEDWLYDPSGNIYGKVRVTVHISDGDTLFEETNIGVTPVQNIHNVIYNANTTINACSDISLKNVQIQGTPTVIFNMNGHDIKIDETFQMPAGATFIVNP